MVLIAFFLIILWGLGDSRWVLILSGAMAYLAFPLVKFLEVRGLRRDIATLLILFFVVSPGTIVVLTVIPILIQDVVVFFRALPNDLAAALQKLDETTQGLGITIPMDQENLKAFVMQNLESVSVNLLKSMTEFAKTSFFNITSAILWIINIILIPLFFFYVIADFERWQEQFTKMIPPALKPAFSRFVEVADRIFSSYLRGQLLACTILAILYASVLHFSGLRFGLLIGILTGVFAFIPYLGFSMGFTSAMIVAFSTGMSPVTVGLMVIGMALVSVLESFYVTPKLVGGSVGLSPLEALIAFIICGNFFGFFGILFALPTAALFKEFVRVLSEESFQ